METPAAPAKPPPQSAARPRPVELAVPADPAAIARATLDGFNRHYAIFRDCARTAKKHFEDRHWLAIAHTSQDRIDFYDRRVLETVARLEREFGCAHIDEARWEAVKRNYISLLIDHKQPECAETFFNSVSCKILHRNYFHNRCLFVRPAVSTDHIDADPPSYRSYYPRQHGLRRALIDVILDFQLDARFADFRRDLRNVLAAFRARFPRPFVTEANHQLQVLSSLFFRNRTAYIVGRVLNGFHVYPFVVSIKHDTEGKLYLDALLLDPDQIALLFSANRAYFLVDMEVPSAYVAFLKDVARVRTEAELYTMVGLQKQGKTLFFRDFLHHLKHSTDDFIVAPGIKGLVMTVFTLPSFPYVFKVIRDRIAPSKETTPERVKEKYYLVKHHDRVGRMADTLEYSDVAIPRARCTRELIHELKAVAPSAIEEDGDVIIVRHVYIERRMTPLNLFLETATAEQRSKAIRDYGDALKQLAAVNIFAGDLLFKNFGVTRFGRVVFYDYDEIEYITNCRFKRIPPPPTDYDEMASEVWYPVGPSDVFPEEFATFLLTDPAVRAAFMASHADLLDADWWKAAQDRLAVGELPEVLSYPERVRFAPRT
ncbi:MAG TPA: bifunctional isocitrate dehydrogenase kinase/phosphatase [Casimicrobiaceae bacterium]|nr:bifunctional isocitrate dehydrogenase kinase/phosphatase [Casimicrobiaceae bacterium]